MISTAQIVDAPGRQGHVKASTASVHSCTCHMMDA